MYKGIIYSGSCAIDTRENTFTAIRNNSDFYTELQVSENSSILLSNSKLILQEIPSRKIYTEMELKNAVWAGRWYTTLYPAPGSKYMGHVSMEIVDGAKPYCIRVKDINNNKVYSFPFVKVPYLDDFTLYGLAADNKDILWVAYKIKSASSKMEQYEYSYLKAFKYNPQQDIFELIDEKQIPNQYDYTIHPDSQEGIGLLWIEEKQENKQVEQWDYYVQYANAKIKVN